MRGREGGGVTASAQHPPGLTDSARSSVIMGELSEDSLTPLISQAWPGVGTEARPESSATVAAAAIAAGIHHQIGGGGGGEGGIGGGGGEGGRQSGSGGRHRE